MDELDLKPEDVPASALPSVKSGPLSVQEYGKWLKALRKESGMTLVGVTKSAGVSHAYLSQIENGLFKPSPEFLEKLAGPLGINYSALLIMAGYNDLAKGVQLREAQEVFANRDNEYDLIALNEQIKLLESITDIKAFLERKVPPYSKYNGHTLTADDRKRLLIILENLFPQYVEKGK